MDTTTSTYMDICETLSAQLAEAKARLADLSMGAQMMLEFPGNWPNSAIRYAQEVKRVAGTPL